jgi:hypothetical protein
MSNSFGICDCGKWGYTPDGFNESRHFLLCDCGLVMYLTLGMTPEQLALRESNRIIPKIIRQTEYHK